MHGWMTISAVLFYDVSTSRIDIRMLQIYREIYIEICTST